MKTFRFRLETLLRMRKHKEDLKKRIVGDLMNQINLQQQQALQLAAAMKKEGRLLKRQFESRHVDLGWVQHYRSYVTATQKAIQKRIETVSRIQQQLNLARQELAQAARQTRILSKLKERRRTEYDTELRRTETRDLDEVSQNIFTQARSA